MRRARAAPHTIVSNRAACLTHISKCVSVQFFPLLKSSVFYSLALKKGSNNFASGSSFCSRRFVRSFFLGWISFFLRTATQYFTYFQNLSARSAIAVIILLTLVIMQYILNIKQVGSCFFFAQLSLGFPFIDVTVNQNFLSISNIKSQKNVRRFRRYQKYVLNFSALIC